MANYLHNIGDRVGDTISGQVGEVLRRKDDDGDIFYFVKFKPAEHVSTKYWIEEGDLVPVAPNFIPELPPN